MFASRRPASVQACLLDVAAIREDVLVLVGGETRAVLEVAGLNLALRSPAEQEAILEGYRSLLNGLDGPVQLVCHTARRDVDAYVQMLRARLQQERSEALVRLALDHFAFVQQLAARRPLLERRGFLVLAGPALGYAAPVRSRRLRWPWLGGSEAVAGREPAEAFEAAQRQLAARAEELRQGLQGIGLQAWRLAGAELASLLHAFLAPEQAARQRLAGAVDVAPVVRARPRPEVSRAPA